MYTLNNQRLALLAFATLLCVGAPALADPPQEVTVFGDSLSDPGNVFALTGAISHTPYDVIPSAPYAVGGLHFSNGKTWIEQRPAQNVNANSSGPAYQVSGVFTNYAVGGARASGGFKDLGQQVADYLFDFNGARPAANHVIFIGGNDIRDALFAAFADPSLATSLQILNDAVVAVAENIQALYTAGARRFVVVNGPDLGLAPAVTMLPGAAVPATLLSSLYNEGLADAVDALEGLPGISIATVDLFGALNTIVNNPADYGLTNTMDMCITTGVKGNAKCKHPKEYLFWDGIHPTSAGHAILADVIGPALEAL